MLVYCDTSMLLKLCVREPGSDLAIALWDGADAVVSSRLADLEVRATLHAAGRSGLLDESGAKTALRAWIGYSAGLRWLEFTAAIARDAAELTERHPIRSSDAIHLASARAVDSPDTTMAVFERRLALAAAGEGLGVLPRFG